MEPANAAQHLTALLGWLKALYWNHWTAHWQTLGDYGDHLLMQRIYEGLAGHIDTMAEKAIGSYGNDAVDMAAVSSVEQSVLASCTGENVLAQALGLEKRFQEVLEKCYTCLKENGRMPMGLDDFIMGMASDHDTYIYLLQQRLRGRRAALNSLERSWMGTSTYSPLRNADGPESEATSRLALMWKFSPPAQPPSDGEETCT